MTDAYEVAFFEFHPLVVGRFCFVFCIYFFCIVCIFGGVTESTHSLCCFVLRFLQEKQYFQGRVSEKQLEEDASMAEAPQRQLQQRLEAQVATQDIDFWRVLPQEVVIMEGESHVLGRGAWGFVAEGRFRGKKVAVKCLHQAILDPITVRRVHREIRNGSNQTP